MPFVHSFSVFLIRRGVDQVAMQIAYSLLNVKLVGFLPGLMTLLGVSQQAIDDLVLMCALPNMTIIEPSGACQIEAVLRGGATTLHGPVYLRMHRVNKPIPITAVQTDLQIGKGKLLREGDDAVIFACGLWWPKP